MADKLSYHEQQKIKNTKKLRELLNDLPTLCETFFRGISQTTAPRTQIAYAIDLKVFFEYLLENHRYFKGKQMYDIKKNDLNRIESEDIERFLEYLQLYEKDGVEITNNERAIKRKLAALRSFYNYFYRNKLVDVNPAEQVLMPKIHDKAIVRLDPNEVATLLDNVENANLTSYKKLKPRDLAILTLLLGTGIRVSECVGLDIEDVDFDNDRIKIVRKGGYEAFVYFGQEVRDELLNYIRIRKNILPANEIDEHALFLSSQRKRLCVRSVEMLVKKHAQTVTTVKKITPHKLRSTYGTSLYQETGDIYLVASVLGHKDVNTTRKHYADMLDESKRQAKDKVTLREK
ncbi:MAG: integrase [Lachnospira sp.]|nr:integrase [Lachnospira sp.]